PYVVAIVGAGFSRPYRRPNAHRPDAIYYLDLHVVLSGVHRDEKSAPVPPDPAGPCAAAGSDMEGQSRSASSRARAFQALAGFNGFRRLIGFKRFGWRT